MVLGDRLYALVSRSGSWQRIEGHVTRVDATYMAYDRSLSGTLFTGAIETDIVLLPGESGTPVWSFSGGLI